jgi:hypothetical protein
MSRTCEYLAFGLPIKRAFAFLARKSIHVFSVARVMNSLSKGLLRATKEGGSPTLTQQARNLCCTKDAPKHGLAGASLVGINDVVRGLVQRGGSVRGVTDISYAEIELAQELLDVSEEVRHFAGYRGMFYAVFDKKYCLSAIKIDIRRLSVNEPASMLYVDDPTYADYLGSTFELLWEQAVPANLRIAELLKQGPTRA